MPSATNNLQPSQVKFATTLGSFIIELDYENAPVSSANFAQYVNDGFYDNTIAHRVILDFMVQMGGFTTNFEQKKTRDPIRNEAKNGLKNLRGMLSMARTQAVDSATSQFFINVADNAFLDNSSRDYGYAVFGKIIAGMDVIDLIAKQPTSSKNGHQDVPTTDVVVLSAAMVPATK